MKRGLGAVVAAGAMTLGSGGVAVAQIDGQGVKSMDAAGSISGGASASVWAEVPGGSTEGEVCVSIKGYLRRETAWQGGCGPVTVEIDDLLNTAHVHGSVRTSYGTGPNWWEGKYVGAGTVTLDISAAATGTPYPAGSLYPPGCSLLNLAGCGPGNRMVARRGSATGAIVSRELRTSTFSGDATLYLQRWQSP